MKEYLFTIEGGFDVSEDLQPIYGNDGRITGFILPRGQTVQLVVSLEYHEPDNPAPVQTVGEEQMRHLGFENLSYSQADFEEA